MVEAPQGPHVLAAVGLSIYLSGLQTAPPACVLLWSGVVWCVVAPGASKVLAGLQTFKVKYAEARAKEHPELQSLYTDKIAAMKQAGKTHRWHRWLGTTVWDLNLASGQRQAV